MTYFVLNMILHNILFLSYQPTFRSSNFASQYCFTGYKTGEICPAVSQLCKLTKLIGRSIETNVATNHIRSTQRPISVSIRLKMVATTVSSLHCSVYFSKCGHGVSENLELSQEIVIIFIQNSKSCYFTHKMDSFSLFWRCIAFSVTNIEDYRGAKALFKYCMCNPWLH